MRLRGIRLAISALLLLTSLAAATPASADARCGGLRGIQVWSSAWYAGATKTWCQNSGGGIARQNLFWEGWNDSISSFQIFNMPGNLGTCFFEHADYQGLRTLYMGNVNVGSLAPGIDNTWSSILTAWPQYSPCY
jgi:hypothetical protein